MRERTLAILGTLVLTWLLAASALASGCFPVASLTPGLVPARWTAAALPDGATARLTFLGHSTFLIESRGGVSAVTDYNPFVRPPRAPDIVTMNNAHGTHYSDFIEPGVTHALRGWGVGGAAVHDVTLRDMRVRNVPTSVHGRVGAQANSNSIFVFEIEDLCIAHLGHLHHLLTDQHLAELGVIDVLLVPVDGAYTMSQQEMAEVIRQIGASIVVPMHYFGEATLTRFLALVEGDHEIVMASAAELLLAREAMGRRRVVVLPGR